MDNPDNLAKNHYKSANLRGPNRQILGNCTVNISLELSRTFIEKYILKQR